MTASAERMRAMRARRRAGSLREIRLVLPDARTRAVRARVEQAVAHLDPSDEADALGWIETVADFDEAEPASSR